MTMWATRPKQWQLWGGQLVPSATGAGCDADEEEERWKATGGGVAVALVMAVSVGTRGGCLRLLTATAAAGC